MLKDYLRMLTKSNYLIGLQCLKLLWITKNDKSRIPEPDEATLVKFREGDMIGVLATKVFEDGLDLADLEFKENLEKTKEGIKSRKTIFEAGILVKNMYSRADILLPVGKDEWDIIEVKSSSKVKDMNVHDVAFQKHVYETEGLKIRNCFLMYLNNQYVKDGDIEVSKLFTQADITGEVKEASENLKENIEKMYEVINGPEPEFDIKDILTIEYDNLCLDEFKNKLPEDNIFQMFRMMKRKQVDLYNSGIIKIKDIPEDVKLNDKQKIQRRLAHDGGKHIDKQGIKNFLGNLKYPIYYLDFETINPKVPKFNGMKPFQRVPFQFSLHIQKKAGGELEHISFLAEGTEDPRHDFMKALKSNLGKKGSILVYNQAFEKGVFNECSFAIPEFRDWYDDNILPRIKDLWDVFKDFDYYDPKQKGSTSIKYVLPVLSDLSYSEMDIKDGMSASNEYDRVTYGDVGEIERDKVYEDLKEYCAMDTMAEVKIVNKLWEICENE